MRILIAEDEPDMRKIIRLYLEKEGYEVETAADGQEAFEKLCQSRYDLLIADWMMPKMSGLKLCEEVRAYDMPVKIIMLTAKDDVESEIAGLGCGADDYVKKPFEPRLLLLRIKKLCALTEVIRCGELLLDKTTRTVKKNGCEVKLTQKEYALFQMFMENQGRTLSREQLLTRVWGNDYDKDERTLDTHVRRLRGKIGRDVITTFVGVGYRMEEAHE